MDHHPEQWHPAERSRQQDLEILASGGETGWWDETGRPAPWPEDFLHPNAGWATADPDNPNQTSTHDDPNNPPF